MAHSPFPGNRDLVLLPDGELLFTPSPRLRAFYLLSLILFVWIGILPWFILATVTLPGHMTLILVLPLLLLILGIRWYIPKYWASLKFRFKETELVCEKGVWRANRRFVPYSRITDVGTRCGIVCRSLGIAGIRLVLDDGTAISLPGVEEPVVVRDILEERVKPLSPAKV